MSDMKIDTLKHIETSRLLIRPVKQGDEIELNQAINRSLPLLQRWMPWAKDPSLETTRQFIQSGILNWQSGQSHEFPMVVIHKETNKIISGSGFNEKSDPTKSHFEIGYWIDSEYQGQGLITEVVNALTRYALEVLKATRVQICMQVENAKSVAVATRCGFSFETTLKNNRIDCISDLPADSLMYVCYDISALPPLAVKWQHS